VSLFFVDWVYKVDSYDSGNYTFLNQTIYKPDTSIVVQSPLWFYNYNYMDYLLQPSISKNEGVQLIEQFIDKYPSNPYAYHPYPIALRCINWIKFFTKYKIKEGRYDSFLYAQYFVLSDNLEYHLLANHLLEDAFSLLFGSFYFNDSDLYNRASCLIEKELAEQVLDDGAHVELSPMYHQILLDRMLDCFNLLENNKVFETQDTLLKLMKNKATLMLKWLNIITFKNGEIPLLNDSAINIAPTTKQLINYASRLGLPVVTNQHTLLSSGYRKVKTSAYECIVDISQIIPSYQPGHAHADTLNFVLNVENNPILVDWGVSTYNPGKQRLLEKSTPFHNTVTVKGQNSSQLWSAFRVGKRARVKVLTDKQNHICAKHDGYSEYKSVHTREWFFEEKLLKVFDTLTGKCVEGKAHFWFCPCYFPRVEDKKVYVGNVEFRFSNVKHIEMFKQEVPNGYNTYQSAYKLEIQFSNRLETTIIFN
jgi:hypothetical protein